MFRNALKELSVWKLRENKKPLVIRGARQVGKTWLMKEFGRLEYSDTVYINFEGNRRMKELFESDFDTRRIVLGIELYCGHSIVPKDTLLIFDEIQEVPSALTSLKYFNEDAPQYSIVCAGSLLGVALHSGTSFPVGKVEFLDLHPLSFTEFITAMGNERFVKPLEDGDFALVTTFKTTYIELLKQYYFIGGMPEVVATFADSKDFSEARKIQQRILLAIEQDFSKHAPNGIVPRIRMLWNSLPAQLAKENKKFIYGLVKDGARAKEYELALLWLCDCGLVHKVHRVTTPRLPLKAYGDPKAFKLFMLDVGLLSCITSLRQETLLLHNELFKEFKGALTEQFVLQQITAQKGQNIYYWTNDHNTSEVDFIVDNGLEIIPLEVKAEVNLQAKSLKVYRERFSPRISVRASMADHKREEGLLNLPLYAIEMMNSFLGIVKQ